MPEPRLSVIPAAEKGIGWQLATAMSATVFARASQFAALEFWSMPVAPAPLLLVVFAVNARHILLIAVAALVTVATGRAMIAMMIGAAVAALMRTLS